MKKNLLLLALFVLPMVLTGCKNDICVEDDPWYYNIGCQEPTDTGSTGGTNGSDDGGTIGGVGGGDDDDGGTIGGVGGGDDDDGGTIGGVGGDDDCDPTNSDGDCWEPREY